jgi:hypothetical protein
VEEACMGAYMELVQTVAGMVACKELATGREACIGPAHTWGGGWYWGASGYCGTSWCEG